MILNTRLVRLIAITICVGCKSNPPAQIAATKTCAKDGLDFNGSVRASPESRRANSQGQVAVEYIAHASFRIHSPQGKLLLVDPYVSGVWLSYPFPTSIRSHAIAVTHPHSDHDSGEFMGKPWPFDPGIPTIKNPGEFTVGDIQVHGFAGRHAGGWGREFGYKNNLFLFEVGGLRIAHLGDNQPLTNDNIQELGRVDILMMPIDGLEHILRVSEVRAIIDALHPPIVIPMHYRLPDLERPGNPKLLGNIDPWLACQTNVFELQGNIQVFRREDLPAQTHILVFQHATDLNGLQ